jgi:nucleotide-binding universal stress UspA family protein
VLAEELWEHLEQQVQTLTEGKVADSPVKVVPKLEFGYPELGLVEISQHADLIVMGTTGKNGWTEKLFGKVSAEVSGEAHCPVLLVPPNVEFTGFSNIVYAANYESLETEKIKQVVTFAEKFNSQIHFVHVNTGDMSEPHGQQLEERLFEINYQYAESKFPFLFHHIKGDDVTSALNTYAMRHHADLIVFITEHRGIWQSLLHESMSKKMMLNSRIPMLVAHLHNDSIEPKG